MSLRLYSVVSVCSWWCTYIGRVLQWRNRKQTINVTVITMPFRKRYSIKMSFIKSKLNNHEKCLCVPPPQPTSTTRGMFPLRKEVVVIALHPPGRLIANKSSKKLALQSSVTILLFGVGGGRTSGIVPARSGGSGPGIFNWLALLQGLSTTSNKKRDVCYIR